MKSFLSRDVYNHFINLVLGIRLLLESSRTEVEKIATMNVRSLKHLANHCRLFGQLFIFSAVSFESQNRQLAEFFTGTHSHCNVICRRYMKQRLVSSFKIERDGLTDLLSE